MLSAQLILWIGVQILVIILSLKFARDKKLKTILSTIYLYIKFENKFTWNTIQLNILNIKK